MFQNRRLLFNYIAFLSLKTGKRGKYRSDIAGFIYYIVVIADLSKPLVVAQNKCHHCRLKLVGKSRRLLVHQTCLSSARTCARPLPNSASIPAPCAPCYLALTRAPSRAEQALASHPWAMLEASAELRRLWNALEDVDRHDRRRRCRFTCMMHSS